MGQFSPSVLPTYYGGDAAKDLAAALQNRVLQDREARAANDAHDVATEGYVAAGGRYGTPPTSAPSTAPAPSTATRASFTNQLAAGFANQPTTGSSSPFAGALDREFNKSRPAPTQALQAAPATDEDSTGGGWGGAAPSSAAPGAGSLAAAMQRGTDAGAMDSRPAPTTSAVRSNGGSSSTPGAFDPLLGGFAPAQHSSLPAAQTDPDSRYVTTGPDRYVDTQKTRQAQQIALSQAMLEGRNAGAYDRAMLGAGTRVQVAGMNNTTRQTISDDRNRNQQDIADERTENAQDIADERDATTRLGQSLRAANAGNAGKSITATAKEANANKAAAAFLNIHGGDYPKALEALKNTPEGQELVASGVEPRHLYIAHGQQIGVDTKVAFGMVRNSSGVDKAVGKLGATRKAVLGQSGGATTGAPDPEAAMSDADLWETKVKGGMSKADATAYVNARKKAP